MCVLLTAPAFAEDPPRRVGSLDYISGQVEYTLHAAPGEPGPSAPEDWLNADFDQPVCQDMSLKTEPNARARVSIGGDDIQMSDNTSLNLLNLTDQLIEASVTKGRIYLQLAKLDQGERVELEMRRGSLWVLQAGAYDLDIGDGDQPTRIVVFEGKARFVGGSADLPIGPGKQVQITGNYPSVATTETDWTGLNPAHPTPDAQPAASPPSVAVATPANAEAASASSSQGPPHGPATGQTAAAQSNPSPPAADKPPAASRDGSAVAAVENRSPGLTSNNTEPTSDQAEPAASEAPHSAEQQGTSIADPGQKSSDEFLSWVEVSERDQRQQAPHQSTRYVSSATTGADALDRYGHWETLPDSEPVWFPTSVPDDWAPYRFGHWDWIEPWGWTWIDDQPWGFAPFHYGRWVNIDGHWGWVPGAVDPHPVYAPALVAFVDVSGEPSDGPDAGPPVAWFPLGPGDDYAPWYPAGPEYVVGINAPDHWHHDLGGHADGERVREMWRAQYFNRRFATVVSRQAFAEERRIDREMVRRVAADRLDHAAVMHGAPRITPVAMRSMPGPGGFRGEPRGVTPASAEAGGLRARPGGGPEREPGMAGHAAPAAAERGQHGGEGSPRGLGRAEASRGAIVGRPGAAQYGRSEVGRGVAPEAFRGEAGGYGRPQIFPGSVQGYRGTAQQSGRPEVAPGFRGGAQQFGRPQVAQGFRGGFQQFGRPQVFQTPAASYRGGIMAGRAAPAVHFTGGGGGGGGRHK